MSTTNAVESLLNRLHLADAIPAFKAAGIDRIVTLRNQTEDQLKELIPDAEQRQKLTDALTRNSGDANKSVGPPAIAPAPVAAFDGPNDRQGGQRVCRYFRTAQGCKKGDACNLSHVDGPPIPADTPAAVPRQRRACRDFFNDSCKYGAECRFSHSEEALKEGESTQNLNTESYMEEVQVPYESVRYLLGNKAERLQHINTMCGTTNSRIEKPESYMSTFSIRVRGSKEGVAQARREIERYVGITSAQNKEARFQYVSNELERNVQACKMLGAFNAEKKGTPLELSESSLKQLMGTFRFQVPQQLTHFWTLSSLNDKEKFEVVVKCVKHLQGVQAILFTDQKRVVEMEKRAKQTAEAFGVANPQFMHRDQTKEVRMKNLEAFKEGELKNGIRQRLLVTNSDYAKLARKIALPYVNLIVHFVIPKTKELYSFQSMCAGRNGFKGISLMFLLPNNDATTQREWSESLPLQEMTDSNWEQACGDLVYDTEATPLNPKDADPPANWKEIAEQEKAAKEAAKAAKKAAKA